MQRSTGCGSRTSRPVRGVLAAARRAAARSRPSAVSGGILPSGGSTISEVRAGLDDFLAVVEPPDRMDRLLSATAHRRADGRPRARARAVRTRRLPRRVRNSRAGEPRRPLERRGAAEVPDALEIGMAVGRARQRPAFGCARRARRGEGDREPQRSEQPRDSMHSRREVTPRGRAAQCVRPREST